MTSHKPRAGSVYKRCATCGRTLPATRPKRCPKCDAALATKGRVTFSWRIDVAAPGVRDDQGRPVRKVRSGHGYAREEEARAALDALKATLGDGTYVERKDVTAGAYLVQWVDGLRNRVGVNLSQGTHDSYAMIVRRYLEPRLRHVRLQDLNRSQVKAMYADLRADGSIRGAGLSAKSVHNVHLCLRKALRDAVEDQLLARNPADGANAAPSKREQAAAMKVWTAEELGRFLRHVAGDRLYAAWRLQAQTGMRRGEVLGLKWDDLDLEAGKLHVVRALKKGAGTVALGATKTGRGRAIALDAGTVTALREHRKAQLEERLACGSGWTETGLVFTLQDGHHVDPDGLTQRFARHVRESGLPRIRLHDLRHTHATLALKAGVHPKVVQERLGHSSINVTLDTYSHAVPSMQADAASVVAALVDGT